ncbi:MAG TPA: DUF6159 family protein [Chitinophagaceae bacterium]
MTFFEKAANGWKLTKSSFRVLNANKQLIIFPILSGISVVLVIGSFVTAILASVGWNTESLDGFGSTANYFVLFVFYVINYFIVVFFNMALIHCTALYFKGEPVSVGAGLRFSVSRIGVIFSWAVFAATIGTLLRIIQENLGIVGRIITGLLGVVWSVATFFVIPIIAYENAGPVDAFRRSVELMKQKWGESLTAGFSLALIRFFAIIVICGLLFVLGSTIHPLVGVAFAVAGVMLVMAILSAVETIFVSAVYFNINSDIEQHFQQQMIDDLFVRK